jgi:hypothetical protein
MTDEFRGISLGDDLGEIPVEWMPAFVRHIYCAEFRLAVPSATTYGDEVIPHWDGGMDALGTRHKPIWPKLVSFFAEHKIDPIPYIETAFALRRGKTPPAPNTLTNAATLSQYLHIAKDAFGQLQAQWQRHVESILNEVHVLTRFYVNETPDRIHTTALCDTHRVEASPLVRYCMALERNLPLVVARFQTAAATQYLCNRTQYDRLLPQVPAPLRDEAVRLQRAMITKG